MGKAVGRIFGYKSGQTGGSSPFHGRLLATIKTDLHDRQGIYQGYYIRYHGSKDREECDSCDRFDAGDYDCHPRGCPGVHEDHVQREGDCSEQDVEQCFVQVPMRRHRNPNKVPPFKPDPEHWTRKVHSWKAKVVYETEDDAWEFLNQNPKLKAQGMAVYRCMICNKYHIGHKNNK